MSATLRAVGASGVPDLGKLDGKMRQENKHGALPLLLCGRNLVLIHLSVPRTKLVVRR